MMSDALLIFTNMPDKDSAHRMATSLIENKAAACVNIMAACTSVYSWQGKVENANEIPLLIKTTRSAYPRVEELIREQHPYELPEIIAVPVEVGLPDYLQWVTTETSLTNN